MAVSKNDKKVEVSDELMKKHEKMRKNFDGNVDEFDMMCAEASHNSDKVTFEQLKEFVPNSISDEALRKAVEDINNVEDECDLPVGSFKEKVFAYSGLIKKGRTLNDLINALKFCSLKLIPGMTNIKAWKIVFPERWEALKAKGKEDKVDAHVAMYNTNDIVVELDKMLILPPYVEYMAYFHESVKKTRELMYGISSTGKKVSPHVEFLAAAKLWEMTKMPEDNVIELRMGLNEESLSIQKQLFNQLRENAELQKKKLENGADIVEVQAIGVNIEK